MLRLATIDREITTKQKTENLDVVVSSIAEKTNTKKAIEQLNKKKSRLDLIFGMELVLCMTSIFINQLDF